VVAATDAPTPAPPPEVDTDTSPVTLATGVAPPTVAATCTPACPGPTDTAALTGAALLEGWAAAGDGATGWAAGRTAAPATLIGAAANGRGVAGSRVWWIRASWRADRGRRHALCRVAVARVRTTRCARADGATPWVKDTGRV